MKLFATLRRDPNLLLIVLLGFWLILNLMQGYFTELTDNEAYYWFISQDLDWGSFEHPPMVALLTWLGTGLWGDTEIGIRFFNILLQPLYLYLFWTLVRTEQATWRMAIRYFLIAFSIPLLQLYGWITAPDAPLMMSVAITLWAYNRYLKEQSWVSIGLLGLGFALMGYSKYHGILVVCALVISNFKLLGQWRFWLCLVFSAMLISPHLVWQYNYDWISLNYQLIERSSEFSIFNVLEYLITLLATFNPFLILVFAVLLWQRRTKGSPMDRAIGTIAWVFMIFFLLCTANGPIRLQWLIPISFSMIYILTRVSQHKRSPYLNWVVVCSATVLLTAKIVIMSMGSNFIRSEISNNEVSYRALEEQTFGMPVILDGSHTAASKLNYYTSDTARAWARPSIHGRNSQFGLRDMERKLHGQTVAIQISKQVAASTPRAKLESLYMKVETPHQQFYFDTIQNYIPTSRTSIECRGLLPKMLTGQRLSIELRIHNPYDFEIPLDTVATGYSVVMQLRQGQSIWHDIRLNIPSTILAPDYTTVIRTAIQIPVIETGKYLVGFSLQRYPFDSWYNSKRTEIQIVNPKTRN